MIGYGDRAQTQCEVVLNQGTISKIEAQYREMGHVRKVPSKRQAVVDDDTKLNLLLALEENTITPARQLAPLPENNDVGVIEFFGLKGPTVGGVLQAHDIRGLLTSSDPLEHFASLLKTCFQAKKVSEDEKRFIWKEMNRIRPNILLDCKNILNDLASCNRVIITWVLGHSGVPGNEEADRLARLG
ncbi:hypothetical protein NQ318_003037 [Aromia moschata]|uniref:RNase H type-1 domain-containing protein n=1 Tax=Aromia moschata TaxID=1265417 RepID=A0AAV8X2Y5_9CUCU|nr:hypothetical protein NQ318_003037 [Aromia moschata]